MTTTFGRFSAILLITVIAGLGAGCKSPERGVPVKLADACKKEYALLEKGSDNYVGPRIAIAGYPYLDHYVTTSTTVSVRLQEEPGKKNQNVYFSLAYRNWKNSFHTLKKNFEKNDVVFETDAGEEIGLGQKLILSGRRLPTPYGKTPVDEEKCVIRVDRIDKG